MWGPFGDKKKFQFFLIFEKKTNFEQSHSAKILKKGDPLLQNIKKT